MRSISSSRDDRNKIGTSEVLRIARQTSNPSSSGSPTSSTMRSGSLASHPRQRGETVAGLVYGKAGMPQGESHHIAGMRIVVNDKNFVCHIGKQSSDRNRS